MLGCYSLDQEGLVFAGGEFDESKFKTFKTGFDNVMYSSLFLKRFL